MTYTAYHSKHLMKDIGRETVPAFSSSSIFASGTAQNRMPYKEFTGIDLIAPLWIIPVKKKKYKFAKPIKVHIYSENDIFFAENETLVVVGTGKTITDAIADLSNHIIHFYQYYKRLHIDKVIGDAVRLKRAYETLFLEEY